MSDLFALLTKKAALGDKNLAFAKITTDIMKCELS